MTGRTSNAELSQRIPIDRRMVLLAEPGSAAQQPAFAQLVMAEVEAVETEFCSAANTNVVVLRRPRKRLPEANSAAVIHRHSCSSAAPSQIEPTANYSSSISSGASKFVQTFCTSS